jgi:ATP-dependent helicase/nuclease subunit A
MSQAAAIKKQPSPPLRPEAEQLLAADPKHSVWVAASAGSGKTKVLVDRFVRLLLDGTLPQRILCLTFTRAAANEMTVRITRMLSEWAIQDDSKLDEGLGALGVKPNAKLRDRARRLFAATLDCPGGLRIKTIHGFAQEILQRFPLEAGITPYPNLLDEQESKLWLEDVRNQMLQQAARDPHSMLGEAVALLARDFGDDRFNQIIMEMIAQRGSFMALLADHEYKIEDLLPALWRHHGLEPNTDAAAVIPAAVTDTAFDRTGMMRLMQVLLNGSEAQKRTGKILADWLASDDVQRAVQFDDYQAIFLKADRTARKRILNKDDDQSLLPAIATETARLQRVIDQAAACVTVNYTAAIITIAAHLLGLYAARKASQAVLDYDDLIEKAVALLSRRSMTAWVLYKLDGGLDHLLIDEAQDTGAAQWAIVTALTDEFFAGQGAQDKQRTLFVVGDEKQSIYSFQHADPAIFRAKKDEYAAKISAAGAALTSVALQTSYRSTAAVLEAVDKIFQNPLAQAGVSVTSILHKLSPKMSGQAGRVELWPLFTAEKASYTPWELTDMVDAAAPPAIRLAQHLAARIAQWIREKEILPALGRSIQPGDIMILLRQRAGLAEALVQALKKLNIPVAGVDRMQLAEQISVQDVLALAQFALLPEDDLNLACVLRGPLLGVNEETLFQLCHGRDHASLWQRVQELASNDAHLALVKDYLARWLGRADQISVYEFFARLLDEPCPADDSSGRRALLRRLGYDALDPLDELLNAAQDFARHGQAALQHFVHMQLRVTNELKRELDQGQDQVRIMTVHGAKGLQAPIVIMPDTMSLPKKLPLLQWDAAGWPCYVPNSESAHTAGLALRAAARARDQAEYRRLFYVGLTRAEQRLYICGYQSKEVKSDTEEKTETPQSWYQMAQAALAPALAVEPKAEGTPLAMLDCTQTAKPLSAHTTRTIVAPAASLPDWAQQAAAALPAQWVAANHAVESPLAHTWGEDADDRRFQRGRLIHRLLEILPEYASAQWPELAARLLVRLAPDLSVSEKDASIAEVMAIMRDEKFAPLFSPQSRAEVPLIGVVNGLRANGRVDRLCVTEDAVWIVDYKTDRPPPVDVTGIPAAYRDQLAGYAALLRQIYPDKIIKTFLLWTYGAKMMAVG